MASPLDFLLGTGLLAGSVATGKEPGEVTQARQFLRNQFTSPTSYSQGLAQQVAGLGQFYDPVLRQSETSVLNDVQQRAIAGRPTSLSTAMGGPEIRDLRTAVEDVLIPRRQAHYADLGREALRSQTDAARYILESSKPDALSEALGKLAGLSFGGGLSGGASGGLIQPLLDAILGKKADGTGGGKSPVGSLVDVILRNAGPISAAASGGINALTSLFSTPGLTSAIAPVSAAESATAIQLLTSMGVPADQAASIVAQQAATAGGAGAQGAGGLLSGVTLQGLLGALGSATAGGFSGYAIGGQLPDTRLGGTAAGAAGGAAAGAIMGSILPGIGTAIGAAIGALTGAAGGLFGSGSADHVMKAQRLAADQQAAGTNKGSTIAFWTSALGEAGIDPTAFVNQANAMSAGQVDEIAAQGALLLIKEIRKTNPDIISLDQVQGFRDGYIQYILQNNRIEQGGSTVQPQNIAQQGALLGSIGSFVNYDSPTPQEAERLRQLVLQVNPSAQIPSWFVTLPGAIMQQAATQLAREGRILNPAQFGH